MSEYHKLEMEHLRRLDELNDKSPLNPLLVEVTYGEFQSPLTPITWSETDKTDGGFFRAYVGTVRIVRRPSGKYHLRLFAPDPGMFLNHRRSDTWRRRSESIHDLLIACQYQLQMMLDPLVQQDTHQSLEALYEVATTFNSDRLHHGALLPSDEVRALVDHQKLPPSETIAALRQQLLESTHVPGGDEEEDEDEVAERMRESLRTSPAAEPTVDPTVGPECFDACTVREAAYLYDDVLFGALDGQERLNVLCNTCRQRNRPLPSVPAHGGQAVAEVIPPVQAQAVGDVAPQQAQWLSVPVAAQATTSVVSLASVHRYPPVQGAVAATPPPPARHRGRRSTSRASAPRLPQ